MKHFQRNKVQISIKRVPWIKCNNTVENRRNQYVIETNACGCQMLCKEYGTITFYERHGQAMPEKTNISILK